MSDLETRLREEMARSVAEVRPAPDPYGRLLRRHRRRAWRWSGAGLAAAVVAALLGVQALAPAGPAPSPPPTDNYGHYQEAIVPLTPWTRQILDAPVRGQAAKDDPRLVTNVAAAMDQARAHWGAPADLDRITVLFVVRIAGEWSFGVAYHNDRELLFVSSAGPLDAPVSALATGEFGSQVGGLFPLAVIGKQDRYTIALAPPGCAIQSAATTTVRADGTVEHTWTAGGDFLERPAASWLFQVTCAGVVREVGFQDMVTGTRKGDSPPTERGTADPAMVREVLWGCPDNVGLDVRSRRILWGGTPPGETRPTVVELGMLADGSAQVCAVTGHGDAYPISTVHGEPRPADPSFPPASLTTAATKSDALVVVRLPADKNLELADRLLVVAPPAATELRVTGGQDPRVTLTGGVGVVLAKVPATLTVEALDSTGQVLATTGVAEPANADSFIAGQPIISDWD
ncbi:hypothetical protein [Dactylosporangium sp. NPDC051541]|uniref:hypothetical protein n=1 Tax=Dactylosporangium sp. NPDC051541 TaxID=3363977 RepID=UPI0037A702A2